MPLQSWALSIARLKYKTNELKYVGVIIIFILLCISISLFSVYHFDFFFKKKSNFLTGERPPPSFGNSQFYCCCLVAKSCPALGDLVDCNPPGFSVHETSQARILEWVAVSFSRGSLWSRDQAHISCTGRQMLYHWTTREANSLEILKKSGQNTSLIYKRTSAEPDLLLLAHTPLRKYSAFISLVRYQASRDQPKA